MGVSVLLVNWAASFNGDAYGGDKIRQNRPGPWWFLSATGHFHLSDLRNQKV